MNDEKPHRRYGQSYSVSFWKDNVASSEADATRAALEVSPMSYPTFYFDWPAQRYELEKLEHALARAFERGVWAAKKEIRDVLGVRARS
jgi:hypothetical protein